MTEATLVLFDNGHSSILSAKFGDVLGWLREDISSHADTSELVELSADLVASDLAALEAIVERLRSLQPATVVISLCHAGVTAPSALLAGMLERAGIPTVMICTALGEPLATFMLERDVPTAPIVITERIEGRSPSDVQRIRDAVGQAVVAALTGPATSLRTGSPLPLRPVSVDVEPGGPDLWEQLLAARLNDGLPIVEPDPKALDAMIGATDLDAYEVLLAGPTPSHAPITVGDVVVNAVLAGCRPEYLPVVIAAVQAMDAPEFRFFQSSITSHPGGLAVVVSGPVADDLGIHSGAGCLGPGFRANATIGRALNLVVMNVGGSVPGITSLATFGSPAQYSLCVAEARVGNPWPLYHQDIADDGTSVVTVLKCEAPHNVLSSNGSEPETVLRVAARVAASLGSNAVRYPADHLVFINPAQAQALARDGFTKRDVQMYLFEHARADATEFWSVRYSTNRPRWTRDLARTPVVRDPDEFRIVVAGGAGEQMMVAPPWGLSSAVTVPVRATAR